MDRLTKDFIRQARSDLRSLRTMSAKADKPMRMKAKTRGETMADTLIGYVFMLESEATNLEQQVPGILASDAACVSCDNEELTSSEFLQTLSDWMRRMSEELKSLK